MHNTFYIYNKAWLQIFVFKICFTHETGIRVIQSRIAIFKVMLIHKYWWTSSLGDLVKTTLYKYC